MRMAVWRTHITLGNLGMIWIPELHFFIVILCLSTNTWALKRWATQVPRGLTGSNVKQKFADPRTELVSRSKPKTGGTCTFIHRMNIYIYIYMYILMYIYIYTYIYISVCVLISVRTPTHTSAFHTDTDHLSWLAFWVARVVRRVSPRLIPRKNWLVGYQPLAINGLTLVNFMRW